MKTRLKTTIGQFTVLLAILSQVTGLRAQTYPIRLAPRNSIAPIFTNNPVAMFVITNLLNETPPDLAMPEVSVTNNRPTGGTYWSLMGPPAPLPMNPFPDLPVYQVGTNQFLIDDRSVDYAALEAWQQAENEALGLTNPPVTVSSIDTNGLWLQIPTNGLAATNCFLVNVMNTIQGQSYDILTTPNLTNGWATELVVTGAVGNITPVLLAMNNRTNLFVWARTSVAYSFYLTTTPISQDVSSSDSVTFVVQTGGNPDLTYQWEFNGTPIDGATSSTLTLNNVQAGDTGDYAVIVSDGTNSIITAPAQLTAQLTWGDSTLIPIWGSRQNYCFRSGVTYGIGSQVQLYGNTVIEGGSVLKFDTDDSTNASLVIMGGLTCETGPYNFATLTSKDDDSVGRYIDLFSTGFPQTSTNAVPYLELASATSNSIDNLRFCFADWGVTTPVNIPRLDVWDCQFFDCHYGVVNLVAGVSTNSLHNVLFSLCDSCVASSTNAVVVQGEHITADVIDFCSASASPRLIALTNSLVWGNAITASTVLSSQLQMNPDNTNFVASGDGNFYLAVNSPFHGQGTAGISSRLQAEFQHKTTFAPVAIPANTEIDGQVTLSPQVQRYTNGAPDLGYYYDVLDYTICLLPVTGGTVTVLPGTAIGVRNEFNPNYNDWSVEGFYLQAGGSFISHGFPGRPNIFTATDSIQETPNLLFSQYQTGLYNQYDFWLPSVITFVTDCETNDAAPPTLDFRFSNFYLPSLDIHFSSGMDMGGAYYYSSSSTVNMTLQDCTLLGGQINLGNPDTADFPPNALFGQGAILWQNNSFENVGFNLDPTLYWNNGVVNCDMQLLAHNNLFRNSEFMIISPFPASAGNWMFEDNLFDKMHILQYTNQPLDYDYNGYWPLAARELQGWDFGQLMPSVGGNLSGGHEQVLTVAPPYANGPFGNYYLSASTPLYQAGSRSASDAGLTQYTTFASQIKDAPNQPVNIGLHYVAAGTNNLPMDSDGDHVPDYVEVENGTDPNNPMTDGVTPDAYNSVYDSVDLDGDGLPGAVERFLGTDPLTPDNPIELPAFQLVSGSIDLPLTSLPTVVSNGALRAYLNGDESSFCSFYQATDEVWHLQLDSMTLPNGGATLQLGLTCSGDGGDTWQTGIGQTSILQVSNAVTADPYTILFTDSLQIQAAVNVLATNYEIDIYDEVTSNLLDTLTGTVQTNWISDGWNLTDTNGNLVVSNSLRCDFYFDSSASSAQTVQPMAGNGGSASPSGPAARVHYHLTRHISGKSFTIAAAGYRFPNSQIEVSRNVVDILRAGEGFSPNDYDLLPSGTYNTPHGDNAFTWSVGSNGDRNTLIDALNNGNCGNFYWQGHGGPQSIGVSTDSVVSDHLTYADLGYLYLQNFGPTGKTIANQHPYRLTILDGCQTWSWDWARTFGVPFPREDNKAIYASHNLDPCAFVGWSTNTVQTYSADAGNAYGACVNQLFAKWYEGKPLKQCLNAYNQALTNSADNIRYLHYFDKWKISGCADLTTFDR